MNNGKPFIHRITLALILIILAGAGILMSYTIEHGRTLKSNPFNKNIAFENPSFAVTDKQLNYYVIDQSMRRIMKIDKNKEILYLIEGGKRDSGHFFYAMEVAVDAEGNLYVLNQMRDSNGFFVEREEIVLYGPTGKFKKVLYGKKYESNEQKETIVQRGQLSGIAIEDGTLIWFETDDKGIYPNKILLSSESYERGRMLPLSNASLLISGVCSAKNGIVYSTRKGEIFFADNQSSIEKLYTANPDNSLKQIPWSVVTDTASTVYFTDLGSRQIKRIDGNNCTETVLSSAIIEKAGYQSKPYLYYNLTYNRDNNLITTTNECNIVSFTPGKGIHSCFSSGIISNTIILSNILIWIAAFVSIIMFLVGFYLFYSFIMKRRFPLILKQLFLYIPLIIISIIAISYMIINDFSTRYQKEIVNKIAQMVQMTQQMGPFDSISKIKSHQDYMNGDYASLRKKFLKTLNYNKDEWNNSYYFAIYRVINDTLYGFMYLNGGIGVYYPFNYFEDANSVYRQAFKGSIITDSSSDEWGDWLYGVGPLYDSNGNIVALIEIGTDLYSFSEQNNRLVYKMIRGVIIVSLLFIIIFMMMTYIFLISIRILRNAVHRISNGDWHAKVEVHNKNDEIADLSFGFNKMSEYILNYISEIVNLNKSYQRFVPEQFLHYLDKDNVTKVQLGDQVQKTMSVLFSDIRSFTTLSEKMTPKENFDFINAYLGEVGPVIRKHQGFIDKYIGDAVMALFPHDADDAVLAALHILDKLKQFNEKRIKSDAEPINIGIGIHTGSLMLGIIGEHERMEGTVISDNVNLASRLEGLTKHFGAAIIVSQTTLESMTKREKFMYRYLGKIRVKGKKDSVGLFEILDAYSPELKTLRIKTKDIFEKGILLYQQKKFSEASSKFSKILTYDKDDKSTILYLSICDQFAANGAPEDDWDGTLIFHEK